MNNLCKSNPLSKIRLPHSAITKSPGLLPMLYSINELCIELEIPRHLIRSWLKSGLPHERDRRNHIWINGKMCASWINEKRKTQKERNSIEANQAYCFRCRTTIVIKNPKIVTNNGNTRISGQCPICKSSVNKGIKNDKKKKLQINT